MIKLTIHADKEPDKRTFPKNTVVIGAVNSAAADIRLREETLKDVHVKITEDHEKITCLNVANDPFVTLNDIPFGKREVKAGDLLQIGETVIRIGHSESDQEIQEELEADSVQGEDTYIHTTQENPASQHHEEASDAEKKQTLHGSKDISKSLETLLENARKRSIEELSKRAIEAEDESADDIDIAKLVSEIEESEEDSFTQEESAKDKPKEEETKKPTPEDEVAFFDEELDTQSSRERRHGTPLATAAPKKTKPKSKGKFFFLLSICFLTILGFVSSGVYDRLQDRARREEVKASRAVADTAMALTYAKINDVTPQERNWTDPLFLKQSIQSVLSPYHEPLASVDSHGRINGSQYMLRIYTNRDLSRFLIIAQPEASLMQWLAPQKAIVLDSISMELRSVEDLRPLNRLLVTVNSLSGDTGKEIFEQVRKETLIPLSTLKGEGNRYGFTPSKGLELAYPGAQNYVYNAPRYSQVGDRLMQEAIDLVSRPGSTSEVKKLQEQLNTVARLPYAVLYSSKGMDVALKAQRALGMLMPEHNFLIAYFRLDDNGDHLKGTYLIEPQNTPYPFTKNSKLTRKDIGSYQPLVLAATATDYIGKKDLSHKTARKNFNYSVDKESPLYKRIANVANQRREKLEPISIEIAELLEQNNADRVPNFSHRIAQLLAQYEEISQKEEKATFTALKAIYDENDTMPLSEFSQYVKAAGLSGIANAQLDEIAEEKADTVFSEEEFNTEIDAIDSAHTFHELSDASKKLHNSLRIDTVPDSKRLVNYQNKVRSKVLEKLNELLFSPDNKLTQYELHPGNRKLLLDILTASWINDADERDFYLSEFENLVNEQLYNYPSADLD